MRREELDGREKPREVVRQAQVEEESWISEIGGQRSGSSSRFSIGEGSR